MSIGYRIQDQHRDLAALLDPEQQWSYPMGGEDDEVRHGVSVMPTLAKLAAYVAVSGIDAGTPVLVEVEGPESDDEPVDGEYGEELLLPTRAALIEDDQDFFDLVSDLVDLRWETGADYSALLETAENRI